MGEVGSDLGSSQQPHGPHSHHSDPLASYNIVPDMETTPPGPTLMGLISWEISQKECE